MTILPLAESTVRKLEAMGYRRGILRKELLWVTCSVPLSRPKRSSVNSR